MLMFIKILCKKVYVQEQICTRIWNLACQEFCLLVRSILKKNPRNKMKSFQGRRRALKTPQDMIQLMKRSFFIVIMHCNGKWWQCKSWNILAWHHEHHDNQLMGKYLMIILTPLGENWSSGDGPTARRSRQGETEGGQEWRLPQQVAVINVNDCDNDKNWNQRNSWCRPDLGGREAAGLRYSSRDHLPRWDVRQLWQQCHL